MIRELTTMTLFHVLYLQIPDRCVLCVTSGVVFGLTA